ncbi:MAG: nucleotidyltransferase family protein [Bacteroidales bacterium]|nr:nucleotidyltransferase family protein [Bacteroidales bacterium]
MVDSLEKTLFELIHLGLAGGKVKPGQVAPELWLPLFAFSRSHCVHTIVYDAIDGVPGGPDQDLMLVWEKEVKSMADFYKRVKAVAEVQTKAWENHSIRAVQLKGLTFAQLYPNPERRIQGDIDWWFPEEEGFERALEVARNNDVKIVFDSDGDLHYMLGGVCVEHHRKGFRYEGEMGVLVHVQEHILKHAMIFGVGMRQICDYALVRKAYIGKIDRGEYAAALEECGLSKWNALLDSAVIKMGILPEAFSKEELSAKDKSKCDYLIELILKDGNFGRERRGARKWMSFLKRMPFFMTIAPKPMRRRLSALVKGRAGRLF